MVEKLYVTWDDVDEFVQFVADKFKHHNYTGVFGLTRGGLVLAVMLSHRLNIPLLMAPHEGCLIVDDIADSGKSLLHYTENDTQFNKYSIMTMYYHERSQVVPDFYMYNKLDRWIVFPWEEK